MVSSRRSFAATVAAVVLMASFFAAAPAPPAAQSPTAAQPVQIPPPPPPLDFPRPVLLPAGKDYPVTDFGAVADGITMNTLAIQKAIDTCAAAGGGTVVIPQGTFMSGALFLKKGTNLRVEKDGMLKGSPFPADYPIIDTRFEGTERPFMAGFINASNVNGITIGGQGTIDGNYDGYSANVGRGGARGRGRGAPTTATAPATSPATTAATTPAPRGGPGAPVAARFPALPVQNVFTAPRTVLTPTPDNPPPLTLPGAGSNRPRLMVLTNCTNVAVIDLHLQNQCVWCLHILYCTDVLAENLDIVGWAPSSDGMDIDSSKRVRVSKVTIHANDDCISIKSGKDADGRRVNRACEDILVVDSHMARGQGGVAMGSEVSGTIRNVEVRDTLIDNDNWAPIRFKSQPTRGGTVENIVYRNVKITGTRQAFEFNLEWTATSSSGGRLPTTVKNVYLINVSGDCTTAGRIHGLPDSLITNILFQDCTITSTRGLTLDNTKNLDTSGLHLTVTQGEGIINRGTQTAITPFVPRGAQGAAQSQPATP